MGLPRLLCLCMCLLPCVLPVHGTPLPPNPPLPEAPSPSSGVHLDIHLKVGMPVWGEVVEVNQLSQMEVQGEEVFLATEHTAHVSLYLTAFREEAVQDVVHTVEKVIGEYSGSLREDCVVSAGNVSVAGTYAMLSTSLPQCLQGLSDAIVNATFPFIVPDQPIPAWVQGLPEPERGIKIHFVQEYGSPNVFSEFQPHVTVACSNNTQSLDDAFKSSPVVVGEWRVAEVAIGRSGPVCGTVLAGKDVAEYRIGAMR